MLNHHSSIKLSIPSFIRHLLFGWLFAVLLEYLLLPNQLKSLDTLDGLAQMSLIRLFTVAAVITLILCLFEGKHRDRSLRKLRKIESFGIAILFLLLSILTFYHSRSLPYAVACGMVLLLLVGFACFGWNRKGEAIPYTGSKSKLCRAIVGIFTLAFLLFVSLWTVSRICSFCTPTYDFGLFSQMFYYMKETGLPLTTLERDGLLSHFAVHVSPIYYLMLPFYMIFPQPATLQVLQGLVLASSVIPLWKLGKQSGLAPKANTLLCLLLLLYPAFAGGCSYDLHENCFLTPLLLWLFYGITTRKSAVTILSAFLTLLVKEDAAVYVAVIGLWLTVKTLVHHPEKDKQNLFTGLGLLALSFLWFFCTTTYLAKMGDGVMTYRYDNFIFDDSESLMTVIKAILLNPMKAIYECVDLKKLPYIGWTLLPLLGLPFLTRRYERYLLLIPYILVNLMSDYQYQHDIFFQYNFGSLAFLFYLALVNLSDLKSTKGKYLLLGLSLCLSTLCFGNHIVPKGSNYIVKMSDYNDSYEEIHRKLSEIPEEASVAATSFYTTALSQRMILYDIEHGSKQHLLACEYIILDPSDQSDFKKYDGYLNFLQLLEKEGYGKVREIPNKLLIFQKQN